MMANPTGLFSLDHIGVVVDDLDDAMRFARETLGLELDRTVELEELQLKTAFYTLGDGVCIELIFAGDPDVRAKRLGSGPARIEHIALRVDSLDAAVGALAEQGVVVVGAPGTATDDGPPQPLQVGDTWNLWTRPDTSDGVVYQLVSERVGDERPAP